MIQKVRLLFIILLFTINIFALDSGKNNSLELFLHFDKLVFEGSEDIFLHISVKNNSETKQIIKIYDEEYTSFMPVVYDLKGRELSTLVSYRLKGKARTDIIKNKNARIITIQKNETFSHIINLKKIYRIDSDSEYRVKAFLFPDAMNNKSIISNNSLNFKVVKKGIAEAGKIDRIRKYVTPERELTPSEIITLFLNAEKDNNWENYFKFLDIEKYIYAYPEYTKVYNQAVHRNDIILKEEIILKFIKYLKEKRNDYILSYEIMDELTKNNDRYYVEALVRRKSSIVNRPYVYKYRYSLDKYENLWIITGIEATVIKENQI